MKIKFIFIIILIVYSCNLSAQLSSKYSTYEKITYPTIFGNLEFVNLQRKAGQEVVFRFIKKQHSLDKYPHKAMLAMAWLEILYNEMVKHPETKKDEDVENLYNIRNQMRKSVGLDENASAQDCIDRFILFSKLLSFGKLEINEIDETISERQKVANNLKGSINKLKKKYKENIDEENLTSDKSEVLSEGDINNNSSVNGQKEANQILKNKPKYFEQLSDLKKLYDLNLIDENEYKKKKKEILDDNF